MRSKPSRLSASCGPPEFYKEIENKNADPTSLQEMDIAGEKVKGIVRNSKFGCPDGCYDLKLLLEAKVTKEAEQASTSTSLGDDDVKTNSNTTWAS